MHVLVADPDPDFTRVLTSSLEREGCVVLPASDGEGLLRAARSGAGAVMLSPNLPRGPMTRLVVALRELGVPVLVMLPGPDETTRLAALSAGAAEVLVRPFPLFDIGELVRRHGRGGRFEPGRAPARGAYDRDTLPTADRPWSRAGQDRDTLPLPDRPPPRPDRDTLPDRPSSWRSSPDPARGDVSARYGGDRDRQGLDRDTLPDRPSSWRSGLDRETLPVPPRDVPSPLPAQRPRFSPEPDTWSPDRGRAPARGGLDRDSFGPSRALERVTLPPLERPIEPWSPRSDATGERAGRSEKTNVDRANLGVIARLWARQASGYVVVEDTWRAPFYRGAPVGSDAAVAIDRGLRGGAIRFEPADVPGPAAREEFGFKLWRLASELVTAADREALGDAVFYPGAYPDAVMILPLPPQARAAFRAIQTRTTLVPVLERHNLASSEVFEGLAVLVLLGLLSIEHQRLPSDIGRRVDVAPVSGGSTVTARDTARAPRSDVTSSKMVSAPVSGAPARSVPPRSTLDSAIAAPANTSRSAPPSGPDTGRPTAGRQAVGAALRSAAAAMGTSSLKTSLKREVELFRDSTPWTVLGIPPTTPPPVVKQAGARMLQRYEQLRSHPDAEVQRLAAQIYERVQAAVIQTAEAMESHTAPVLENGPDEAPFQQGLLALHRGDYAAAERAFTRARDLVSDSARNLAYLGWARYNNPSAPVSEREDDGISLIQLAEQFDVRYSDAQMFLATIHLRRGEETSALRRARRVLKNDPSHAEAAALVRRLSRAHPQG